MPYIRELSRDLNQKLSLGVLWGRNVCYLYHGTSNSQAAITEHQLYPAEDSSIGLCLLAYNSNEDIQQIFGDELGAKVLNRLETVRTKCYARSAAGSLAVCIGGELQLGGLAVYQFDSQNDDLRKTVRMLKNCAAKIAEKWRSTNGKV